MDSNTIRVRLARVLIIGLGLITLFGSGENDIFGYRLARGAEDVITPKPMVVITSPNPGIHPQSVITVEVLSLGSNPILSTELWVNGVLAGAEYIPDEGATSWTTTFKWIPSGPGVYALVAGVIDSQDNHAYSSTITVVIQQTEERTQADYGALPQVIPSAASASLSADTGPRKTNGAPAAPELRAESAKCQTILSVHDLSNNEEGFVVYRQMLREATWTKIATIGAQSELDWLIFEDKGVVGGLMYYVEAYNSQGQASSNPVAVNVDPADCDDDLAVPKAFSIQVTDLEPQKPVDQLYCYKSFGNDLWIRWPEVGFFHPGETQLDLQQRTSTFAMRDENDEPLEVTKDLQLDCWGWKDGELFSLGMLSFEGLSSKSPGAFQAGNEFLSAEVLVAMWDFVNIPMMPMGGGPAIAQEPDLGMKYRWYLDKDVWDALFSPYFFTNDKMPSIVAWETYDQSECDSHLPDIQQGSFFSDSFCQPYWNFYNFEGSANPQPYLVWSIQDHICPGGVYGDCMPFENWKAYAEYHGGGVYYVVEELWGDTSSITDQYYVQDPDRSVFVIPPRTCMGYRDFTVQMHVLGAGGVHTGLPSNSVQIPCNAFIEDHAWIDVWFRALVLSEVDDGGDDDVIETLGEFVVSKGPYSWKESLLFGGDPSACAGLSEEHSHLCGVPLTNETYPTEIFKMCRFGTYYDLSQCNYTGGYHNDNNHILVPVYEGDNLKFRFSLFDNDDPLPGEWACDLSVWSGPKTIAEWSALSNYDLNPYQPFNGDAACQVFIEIKTIPAPPNYP
jgi:hypothetical protein